MTPLQVLASTVWSEDRGGGRDGMEPIAGVILNRVEQPAWWGRDIVGVCLCHGQFSGWSWSDPNFRPLITVDERDAMYQVALGIANSALRGLPIERACGASHYHARSIASPAWAVGRAPCFETRNHLFFKIGPGG